MKSSASGVHTRVDVSRTEESSGLKTEPPTDSRVAAALLADAERLIAEQRHAQAVMSLARALEVTLAGCMAAILLAPAGENRRSTVAEVEMLRKRYRSTIGAMSLSSLRNVLLALITRRVRPGTIAEALEFVEQSKRFAAVLPAGEHFAAISDANERSTVEALRDATIINVCNSTIHQLHLPTGAEVEEQRRSVTALVGAVPALFGLGAWAESPPPPPDGAEVAADPSPRSAGSEAVQKSAQDACHPER